MQKIYLSLIIPVYNEEENLKRGVLREIYDFLINKDFSWEVIISDDGSTDKSKQLIKSQIREFKNFRLLENPHGGKPSALLHGIRATKGEYILFTDMDQSTPVWELDKLLPFADEQGVGAVIGSRGLAREDFPFYRRFGAIVFATVRRILILPEITDTQCGFKLFKSDGLKKVFPQLEFFKGKESVSGWKVTSYDVELLHMLKKLGLSIREVPVAWNDKDISESKERGFKKYLRESKEMLQEITKVKLNDLLGRYN